MVMITLYAKQKKRQMYRTDFWTLWEKARVGCSERTALKQVYYQGWNRSPAQVGCMRRVLRAGALGRPRGMGWRGRWEGASGWGTHVNPWLIHVNVWQKPLQYCKVISLQLIKIKGKKRLISGLWYWNIQGIGGLRRGALCDWRRVMSPGAEFCMKGGSRWRNECWKHISGRSHSETRNADVGNSMFYFGNFARMQIRVQERQTIRLER